MQIVVCLLTASWVVASAASLGASSTTRHRPDDRLDVAPPLLVLLVRDREVGPPPQIESYKSDGARRREGLLPAHHDILIK